MRSIRALGLSSVVAITVVAFVGVSVASGEPTAFCSTDQASCPEVSLVKHIHYEDKEGILKTTAPSMTIKCVALYLGDVLSPYIGEPLLVHGNLSYSGCKPAGCEAKEVSTSSLLEFFKEGSELATLTGSGEVLAKCGEILHCVYNGEGLTAHALGPLETGDNGHITISEQAVKKVSGTLCPTTAKLTLLAVALPGPVYLARDLPSRTGFTSFWAAFTRNRAGVHGSPLDHSANGG